MELRRQCHDDGVDVVTFIEFVDGDLEHVVLGGEACGPIVILVGNGMEGAETFERTHVVAAPVAASQYCNLRHDGLPPSRGCSLHIHDAPG